MLEPFFTSNEQKKSHLTNNEANASYDMIIIGLGAMGSATLYQALKLCRNKKKILGIDRYEPPSYDGFKQC